MDNLQVLLTDPIVLFAGGGLATLLAIGGFYIYYFMTKINNNQ